MKANLKYKKIKAVYFIRINGLEEVKIGYALDLFTRFRKMDYPNGFEVLGVIYCHNPKEVFDDIVKSHDHNRHWFNLSRQDVNNILDKYDSLRFFHDGRRYENFISPVKCSLCRTEEYSTLSEYKDIRIYASCAGLVQSRNGYKYYTC